MPLPEDTVVRLDETTATISVFLKAGKLHRTDDGRYVTTDGLSFEPQPEPLPPARATRKIDPNSPLGLQMRGFQVSLGGAEEEHRVCINGTYYRITHAIDHGLIPAPTQDKNQ
ncbi:hypothetical protein [Pseudomonas mediterranea]|uniref:hypothetical protein n=1 Tax=Pseudomonas mediterranea TaxID=183795 RepID=UPI0006D89AD8|nr:hypothetical protein [Pseudomonas mediterranea]